MWVPVENVCGVLDTQRSKKTILATLVTDLVLLFTMLFGLLRLRRHGTMFGLGQLLWKQVGNEVSRSRWSLIIFVIGSGLALRGDRCGSPPCSQSDRSPSSLS